MIRLARPHEGLPPRESPSPGAAYDGVFWLTYMANTLVMVAVSVLFRYADFIYHLGGGALDLGLVVGIGTIGALAMRVFQGIGIDRYGPRRVWLLSLALYFLSMVAHLTITRVDAPGVYLVRILMMVGLAGAFGASITFISLRAPKNRLAEMIGMLGTSGFVGMALGPTMGDWLFNGPVVTRVNIEQMFLCAAAAVVLSFLCAIVATRGKIHDVPRRQPAPWPLIKRYHPGVLLLVATAMGVGIGLPGTFLRPYAVSLGIHEISTFFLVYAGTAFVVRVSTRRMHDRFGPAPMILLGLASLSGSMLIYLMVSNVWLLVLPALVAGVAHAFLFPSVVAGGSTAFPTRYRGLATTLMLAMFDVGVLIGQPLAGGLLEFSPRLGLPPYPTMFVAVAIGLAMIAVCYLALHRRRPPRRFKTPRQTSSDVSVTPARRPAESTAKS